MKNKKGLPAGRQGMSLIEIMIVIALFSVISALATRAIALTLRGAKRSESQVKVRENVNHALSIIERQIRNSQSVECDTSSSSLLNYTDRSGLTTTFSCESGFIASGSARLTASDINLTNCSFSCLKFDNNPAIVSITVSAEDLNNQGLEKASFDSETTIISRNY